MEIRRYRLRLRGMLRVSGLLACVTLGLLVLVVSRARARTAEASFRVGQHLTELSDLLGKSSQIRINGNTMFAGGRYVALDFRTVLDRFEAHCRSSGWNVQQDVEALLAHQAQVAGTAKREPPSSGLSPASLTFARHQSDVEGTVVCVAPVAGRSGAGQFIRQARTFLATGELSALGELRYVFAKQNAKGGSNILTVWTEGSFNVERLMDQRSDAPGEDLKEVPRPPGSRRMLQAEVSGSPYSVRSYATQQGTPEILGHYSKLLVAKGFREQDLALTQLPSSRAFTKNGAAMIVAAQTEGDYTRVDLLELGSRGFTTARQP